MKVVFERKHGKVSWSLIDRGVVKRSSGNRIQRGAHPAYLNKPKETTKSLSSVNGLVVQQHSDGSLQGSTIEVIATVGSTGRKEVRWSIKDGVWGGILSNISNLNNLMPNVATQKMAEYSIEELAKA